MKQNLMNDIIFKKTHRIIKKKQSFHIKIKFNAISKKLKIK